MDLKPYITHTFDGLEYVNDSIKALHEGDCLRAVVKIAKDELPTAQLPTLKSNIKLEKGDTFSVPLSSKIDISCNNSENSILNFVSQI